MDTAEEDQKRPRRNVVRKSYAEDPDVVVEGDNNDDDDDASTNDKDDDDDDDPLNDTEDDEHAAKTRRVTRMEAEPSSVRKSNRSTQYRKSFLEPTTSMLEYVGTTTTTSRSGNSSSNGNRVASNNNRKENVKNDTSLKEPPISPRKSPAKRHVQRRQSLSEQQPYTKRKGHNNDDDDEDSDFDHDSTNNDDDDDDSNASDDDDDEEDEEPFKIQRIVASRTETITKWREICQTMNTSEVHFGSRWYQSTSDDVNANDDSTYEERFLVKWADLSYLHVSWETERDLIEQLEGQSYLKTFFRKSTNGLLYSADERCDGTYFDPAYTEIDRILEVNLPDDWDDKIKLNVDNEDNWDNKSFGMILDKADPNFDNGTGRQLLIKWCNTPYSESTFEFERDFIMNDVEYKTKVKEYLRRTHKPTKNERRTLQKEGEGEFKRLYNIFGNKSKISDIDREKAVEEHKQSLQNVVYKNGGQLRDYQAEGVAWMIANIINQRGSILADEMGLGKTLQTAATIDLVSNKFHRDDPILIVAPLSTLTHWYREFVRWTDLNAIIYHGTAIDRRVIRENEFAYPSDRPKSDIGINQLYLKKCGNRNGTASTNPWMIDVVITSPEIMIADDANELSAVQWELLVVDEAHRLKNHRSKLSIGLRGEKFTFRNRILLTGTPIQNDVQEFWSILNFVDPQSFQSLDDFMTKYGDMKSKESVDELHEEIRHFILRRLKEDVEKSVPPKEETLIEVELTTAQKQYYRALYEKNVQFLHKNKKPMDGPSLNNLAMQLRKCCNHLFLLNGAEAEFRSNHGVGVPEGDFLVMGSGKLILLDKLLPRLKMEGHRVILFSQFKIMLDIIEDYLRARDMQFERIDGSITGNKRQQAIDRFQAESTDKKEAPFIMLLSTRAGGVGITLTAADTCIIFDSDWNPQNDLQAQARCHRIGQTKSVKVYRLLTRKTYEMQMFHMSSLKMGLDQVVLKGFESSSSGEGALTKAEVEKLLRHGAYDIFNEEKAGQAEAESNEFIQQDIDSILQRCSHTIVHDNTGSTSSSAGGTFSKASFKAKTPDAGSKNVDVDIDDPDFWKKMIGEGNAVVNETLSVRPRMRALTNYNEIEGVEDVVVADDDSYEQANLSDDDESDDQLETCVHKDDQLETCVHKERDMWGGSRPNEWKKDDVDRLVVSLATFGYGRLPWVEFTKRADLSKVYDISEVKMHLFV
jgi:SNF2 family DNA or RNA helicase